MSQTKACTKCGITKKLTDFSKQKSSRTGYTSQCKICRNNGVQPTERTHAPFEERKPQVIKNPIWRSQKELEARRRAAEAIF